jgi:hypothetical protein
MATILENIADIFGFTINKSNDRNVSIVGPDADDGALERSVNVGSSHSAYSLDVEKRSQSEVELINKCRVVAQIPAVDKAIENIVSDAVIVEESKAPVSLSVNAPEDQIPENVQEMIVDEFQNVLTFMKFSAKGHELFRQWYIDGRQAFHIIMDEADPKSGIREIRFIDPRKIKKVREIQKQRSPSGTDVVVGFEEYFVFNDAGINANTQQGVKLSVDSIAYVTSGLLDEYGNTISFLNKALKPANQLRYMEDALLIYQLSRAPQRRIFYVDVSGMQKQKAEQHLKDTMNRFRNKMVYDTATGELKDDRNNMSMLEDFWMPRTSTGRTTEITTLDGNQMVGQLDSTQYFLNNLYQALNVPISRLVPDASFSLGRSSEITRDELMFSKFIDRLRKKYTALFSQLLRVQLVAKNIIKPEDWDFIESKLQYAFARDNYFAEMKDAEILMQRLQLLQQIEPFKGIYYSEQWVKKNVLRQSSEEIEEMDGEMEEEREEIDQEIADLAKMNPQLAAQAQMMVALKGIPGLPPLDVAGAMDPQEESPPQGPM